MLVDHGIDHRREAAVQQARELILLLGRVRRDADDVLFREVTLQELGEFSSL